MEQVLKLLKDELCDIDRFLSIVAVMDGAKVSQEEYEYRDALEKAIRILEVMSP